MYFLKIFNVTMIIFSVKSAVWDFFLAMGDCDFLLLFAVEFKILKLLLIIGTANNLFTFTLHFF